MLLISVFDILLHSLVHTTDCGSFLQVLPQPDGKTSYPAQRRAPFLIVTAPGHADKDLSAAFVRLVDVPVVTAVNWTTSPQSLVVAGFNSIHFCALCKSFLTSSFCQVIFLFLPRSKPLLQG